MAMCAFVLCLTSFIFLNIADMVLAVFLAPWSFLDLMIDVVLPLSKQDQEGLLP